MDKELFKSVYLPVGGIILAVLLAAGIAIALGVHHGIQEAKAQALLDKNSDYYKEMKDKIRLYRDPAFVSAYAEGQTAEELRLIRLELQSLNSNLTQIILSK